MPPVGAAPGYYQTSEFLAGKVAVGIIVPESDGSYDPSTENWDRSRLDQVLSQIQAALDRWARENPAGGLSLYYDVHYQVPTSYEPNDRSSGQSYLWVSETLANIDYPDASRYYQTYACLNGLRVAYGTDWAIAVFVVDSLNDVDGVFSNGYLPTPTASSSS